MRRPHRGRHRRGRGGAGRRQRPRALAATLSRSTWTRAAAVRPTTARTSSASRPSARRSRERDRARQTRTSASGHRPRRRAAQRRRCAGVSRSSLMRAELYARLGRSGAAAVDVQLWPHSDGSRPEASLARPRKWGLQQASCLRGPPCTSSRSRRADCGEEGRSSGRSQSCASAGVWIHRRLRTCSTCLQPSRSAILQFGDCPRGLAGLPKPTKPGVGGQPSVLGRATALSVDTKGQNGSERFVRRCGGFRGSLP